MKFPIQMIGVLIMFAFTGTAFAAVGVSSGELQSSIELVTPSGESLTWENEVYKDFSIDSVTNISGGIQLVYETRLSSDPYKGDSLPHVQLTVLAYENQEAAEAFYDGYVNAIYASGSRTIVSEDSREIYYESRDNKGDLLGALSTDQSSLHLLHVNGSLLYEASFYQEDAALAVQSNLDLFDELIEEPNEVFELMNDLIDKVKIGLSLLFPPTSSELQATSEISSMNLSELYEIPGNGNVSFELYTGNLSGAAGTVLDSSGLLTAVDGDFYLYLSSSGLLQAGVYAPDYDSDCDEQSGWVRLTSNQFIEPYEWNNIDLSYGVNGLELSINGESQSCNLWQSYSKWDLYLGDYPDDNLEQSFIGRLDNVEFSYSYAEDGRTWDEVFEEQIFYDLDADDEDFLAFESLHNQGVFMGSMGYVYPERTLNRAEMVKVLLKAFGIDTLGTESTNFPDVPNGVWYESYVGRAMEIGMVEGQADGSFSPESTINRAEFYTMLYRLSGIELESEASFSDVDEEDWFFEAASFADLYGMVDGSNFNAEEGVSRREAAAGLYELMNQSLL